MQKIFISYSHNAADVPLLNELKSHLASLSGKIEVLVDDQIPPGSDWDGWISENLSAADIILLLVSSDYIASKYINQVEVPQALDRKKAGVCEVVPIFLRNCYFKDQPYANLEFLPKMPANQKLTAIENWTNRNDAFTTVIERLAELIKSPAKNRAAQIAATAQKTPENWVDFFEIHPLKPDGGIWMTVNCNRKKHFTEGIYQDFVKNRKEEKSLLYIVSACQFQKPASLARRLVYQLIAKNLKIAYLRSAARSAEIAEIELKIGLDPDDTWSEAWKEVLQKLDAQAESPEELATKTHCQAHDKIALIFRASEKLWDEPDLEEHLAFIATQFDDLPKECRKFVLFFVFEFDRADSTGRAKCQCYLDKLDTLADGIKQNSDSILAAHFQLLPPVAPDDVVVWFNDRVQNQSPESIKTLLATLKNQLDDEDQKRPDFDMIKVEEMQAEAWKFLLRPQPESF